MSDRLELLTALDQELTYHVDTCINPRLVIKLKTQSQIYFSTSCLYDQI